MNDTSSVDYVHIKHSDNTGSRFFLKRQEFPFFVTILRKYAKLFVPLFITVIGILNIMPFVSKGPIYLASLKFQFLIPCEGSWFVTPLLVSNLLYWDGNYENQRDTCHPYITNEGALDDTTGKYNENDISVSTCKDACAPYLQVFANLFQFYLLTIAILFIHKYARRISYAVIWLLVLGSTGIVMMFIFNNDIKAYLFYDPNYVLYLMHRPWFRLPSYLMGLFAGLIVSRIHYSRYKVTIAFER
jgi:hypothetical protein